MKSNIDNFSIKIIDTFKLSSLGEGKYVFVTQFPENIFPKIGDFLIYPNEEFWRISGVATSAVDRNGKDLLQERKINDIWDLQVEPLFMINKVPDKGTVTVSSKLPATIVQNKN